MPSQEFASLLGECQQAINDAQFPGWEPPGSPQGERYNAQLIDVKDGAKTNLSTGKQSVWVRIQFRITEGPFRGKEFGIVYSSAFASAFGDMFALVSLLSGNPAIETTRNTLEAVKVLESFKGRPIVQVIHKVETYTKRDGTPGTNNRYLYGAVVDVLNA